MEGWNFVSFPIADQSTPDIKQVLDTSDVEIMWTKENGSWRSYDPEAPPEVNDLKKLRGGRGYILKASENFTLAPNVNNKWVSDDDKSIDQANTSLKDGSFNLLGQFQEYYQEADTGAAFGSISDGDVGRVYEQKEPGTLELTKIKATDVNDTSERMIPGHAYQVWIKQGDAWTWAEAKR